MLIKKITTGFVVQVFNTKTKKFVSQEFVAGDEVNVEDEMGNPIDEDEDESGIDKCYLPFYMVQPDEMPEPTTDE